MPSCPERLPLPMAEIGSRSCGTPTEEEHDEECELAEHEAMLDGDQAAKVWHDPHHCYWYAFAKPPVLSQCHWQCACS